METMSSLRIEVFDTYAKEYDTWFDDNMWAYKSEIMALHKLVPTNGKGLDIGAGTGRFAVPLGIRYGVEPAKSMVLIARRRGMEIYEAVAEKLPFIDETFDFVLMVTTICFFEDPSCAFREAGRVLKPGGVMILGTLDRNSRAHKNCESNMDRSRFYHHAHFYSVEQILMWITESGFSQEKLIQTVFKNPEDLKAIDEVKDGYGDGIFVVISARKETGT